MSNMEVDPGHVFAPQDHELLTFYLRSEVAGEPCPSAARNIHHADVYSAVPDTLVADLHPAQDTDKGDGNARVWYFFCPAHRRHKTGGKRRQRTVGAAGDGRCWHSEGGDKPVVDPHGRRVGHLRKLSYGIRASPCARLNRLGWCMTEYGLDGQDGDVVLCKVYPSPRKVRPQACSSAATPNPTPVPAPPSSGSKRKAFQDLEEAAPPPRSVRQQRTTNLMPMNVEFNESFDPAGFLGYDQVQEEQQVPPCVDPAGFLPQEEQAPVPASDYENAGVEVGPLFVQTVQGSYSEYDVIQALAMGATVDDLLGAEQQPHHSDSDGFFACPAPEPAPSLGDFPCPAAAASSGSDSDLFSAASSDDNMSCPAPAPAADGSYSWWDSELAQICASLLDSPRLQESSGSHLLYAC